jgi:Surface adhesin CshA non-repetitive domain 2/GEVED domain
MNTLSTLVRPGRWQRSRYLAALGILSGVLHFSQPARAQVAYATGGTGRYRNNIAWLTWGGGTNGTNNALLTPGTTNTTSLAVGSNTLVITTTISNFTNGTLQAYRSGSYNGDGLDNAYHIGGNGTSNQLVSGIENVTAATTVSFRLTLSATFNGVPISIPSIVLADAEVSTNAEYVEVTADGNWSAMEISAGCTNVSNAAVSTPSGTLRTLRLNNPNQSCGVGIAGPDGIVSLAFNPTAYTNGQTTLDATVKGEGKNALAIGLLLPFDYGDAPASTYGYATHLIPQIFDSPLASGSVTNLNAPGYTFASLTSPPLRLGARIDADNNSYTGSATLAQDDNNLGAGGSNDEDGVSFSPLPVASLALSQPIASYSVTASVYNATGQTANLVGWIDWDNSGTFDATEAATAAVPSTGGSANVTLTWTNQTVVGTRAQAGVNSRFRLTTDALTASMPSGGASNGEVEDYIIAFSQPLPVTLVAFTAKATTDCGVDLNWRTASELNSSRYEVQRSLDGTSFTRLDAVASHNSTSGASYHYRDTRAFSDVRYYRLRMVDQDGSASYSPVAVAAPECGASFLSLVPNPAATAVTVQGLRAGQQVRVVAADGRLVHAGRATEATLRLSLAAWPRGLYLLHVLSAAGSPVGQLRLLKE